VPGCLGAQFVDSPTHPRCLGCGFVALRPDGMKGDHQAIAILAQAADLGKQTSPLLF
jgi:hypothetical protein